MAYMFMHMVLSWFILWSNIASHERLVKAFSAGYKVKASKGDEFGRIECSNSCIHGV